MRENGCFYSQICFIPFRACALLVMQDLATSKVVLERLDIFNPHYESPNEEAGRIKLRSFLVNKKVSIIFPCNSHSKTMRVLHLKIVVVVYVWCMQQLF